MDREEPMDFTNEEIIKTSGHRYRGVTIIAIFENFHPKLGLSGIRYLDNDKALLKEGFQHLQYGVIVWQENMTKDKFFQRLQRVSEYSVHEDCETMAIVIITHGSKNGKLYAYDEDFTREDVINVFDPEQCIGLKEKLKLFIFHACRGSKFGTGEAHPSGKNINNNFPIVKLGDHIKKDNLILCSTFEGNVALGPTIKDGSFFINALSTIMKEEAKKMESSRKNILELLTTVIRSTASKNFGKYPEIIMQQPTLMMALHRLYYFKNKENFPNCHIE